jgi:hypothetical protein
MNGFSCEAEHILATQIIICAGRSVNCLPEFGLCVQEGVYMPSKSSY